ncbi:TetR/AcrR family transcriptional regulator [Xanthobacteraceae bacterium A53D]
MMERSPAAARIVVAAIDHFAERGYDASSLTEIAEAVGIRKASLYAHFSSKDALFMAAFGDVMAAERACVAEAFAAENGSGLPGLAYGRSLITRFAESAHLRLLLRTGYMPPAALRAEVDAGHEIYLAELKAECESMLKVRVATAGGLSADRSALYSVAYLGIIDSVQVKLIYTDAAQAQARLDAMWRVLELAFPAHRPEAVR